VDCDPEALGLARENVDMLEEEGLIGRINESEDDGECGGCLGVEIVMAKVKYSPPKRNNFHGRGGAGGRGHRGGRGGRGKRGKGRGGNNTASPTLQNELLYSDPRNNDDDGIPLPSKVVDTVITK